MAELNTLMKNRRSIRKYMKDKMVSDEILQNITNAAFYAPSAANMHGIEIVVVTEQNLKKKIREICEKGEHSWVFAQPEDVKESILSFPNFSFQKAFLEEAPILIIVSTNPNNPNIPYAVESCWLSIAYILLEIENNGLGSLTYTPSICLTDKKNELNKILNLPEDEYIQTIIPVGYYEDRPDPKELEDLKKKKIHRNKFERNIEKE
ncbi:MAG: nitroreductase family protein [Promethearchaeota archaeon]